MIQDCIIKYKQKAQSHRIGLLYLCIVFLASCANPLPPSGGPKDTIPPSIISSIPASGTIGMKSNTITLEFSEYVDRTKVASSLFMNPSIAFETSWSGKELEISFMESLKENTTYSLTLGTDYTDYAGNKPTDAFTVLFSTGNGIDSGIIQGKVFGKNAEGAYVFLYRLGDNDTMNPTRNVPAYKTQIGSSGQFTMSALQFGKYRLYALQDIFKDGLYDIGTDGYAIPFQEVECKSNDATQYFMKLRGPNDTIAPLIYGAKLMSPGILEIQYSEAMDSSLIQPEYFKISTIQGDFHTQATAAYIHPFNNKAILVEYIDKEELVKVSFTPSPTIAVPKDNNGNIIQDSLGYRIFSRRDNRDFSVAIPSILSVSLKDSMVGMPLEPLIRIVSSHALNGDSLSAHSILQHGNTIIPCSLTRITASTYTVTPSVLLDNDTWYTYTINCKGLQDSKGTYYKDTIIRIHCKTEDRRTYGSIKGILQDKKEGGPYYIALKKSDNSVIATTVIPQKGSFTFSSIPPGTYTLEAYEDRDSSGSYSYGDITPFRLSERFTMNADTGPITVRARWAVDGIIITMP